MIRIIALIYFGNAIVEGCLKKQQGTSANQPDEESKLFRQKLKACYKLAYTADQTTPDLDGTIDFFVLHSRWLETLTDPGEDCETDKTATCWKEELKDVIPEYTALYSTLAACFDTIQAEIGADTRVRREITIESKVRSRRTPGPDNSNMFTCPELTAADFKTKFDENTLTSTDFINTDESFAGIQGVAQAFITYIRCPWVTCDLLATASYNVDTQTSCNHCWYATFAALAKTTSAYRTPFVKIAFRQQQASNIVCVPTAIITVHEDEVSEMEATTNARLYLGKHAICSDDDGSIPAVDADCWATDVVGYETKTLGVFDLSDGKREKCQREVTVANGKLKFTYVVTKVPTIDAANAITRYSCASKTFVCELPISQVIDITPHPITPTIKHITSIETAGTSNYRLSFALTGGDASVEVGSDIAATITLENVLDRDTYTLVAGKCWATPTDDQTYDATGVKYDLIDCHGCPADTTDTAFSLTTNRDSSKVEFSVESFTWTSVAKDAQLIYIHCEVKVYDTTTSSENGYSVADCSNLPPDCPTNRFRRGVNMEDSHLLSFGPITPFHKRQGQMHD